MMLRLHCCQQEANFSVPLDNKVRERHILVPVTGRHYNTLSHLVVPLHHSRTVPPSIGLRMTPNTF